MSFHPPTHKITLPNRTAPIPTGSPFGWTIDWLSQTWSRFNCALVFVLMVFGISIAPNYFPIKLLLFSVSPILAVFTYASFRLLLIVMAFSPKWKYVFGYMRIIYCKMFSRLVVQKIEIEIPVWH